MTYNSIVLADSPRHYLTFDQAAGAYTDTGSSAAALTVAGSPTQNSTGVSGGHSVQLNGTTQYLSINSSYDISAGTTWSWEVWFKSTATTGTPTMLRKDGGGRAYLLRLNAGKLEWYCNVGASNIVTTGTYADGNWHHVVGTYSGGSMKLYIDGAQYGTTGTGNSGTTGSVPTYVGAGGSGGSNDNFPGTLDEVAIYSTALTSTQVTAHYNAGLFGATVTPPVMNMTNLTVPAPVVSVVNPDATISAPAMSMTGLTVPTPGVIINTSVAAPAATLSLSTASPTVNVSSSLQATATQDSFGHSTFMDVVPGAGNGVSGQTASGYILFPSVPTYSDKSVNTATLNIEYTGLVTGGTPSVSTTFNIYRLTQSWAAGTGSNSSERPTADLSTVIASFTIPSGTAANTWYSANITSVIRQWLSGTTNYGVMVMAAPGSSSGPSYKFAGYAATDTTTIPHLDVTYAASTPASVSAPAMSISMATASVASYATSGVTAAAPAFALSLDFPGGNEMNPDYLALAEPMTVGLSAPDVDVEIRYPVTVSVPPVNGIVLDTASPTVDLTTNVLKVAPPMAMSLNTVGIFDAAHDRYLVKVTGTLNADDIWYKMDEASGATRPLDSEFDGTNWKQSGTYYGTPTFQLSDGPQLRKAVHFNGTTDFMTVGPYAINNSDTLIDGGANDVTTHMAVTVEFSLRTSQTDGVVFIGTGAQDYIAAALSPSASVGIGPKLNGNELRLEGGYLVFANAAGKKVRVRKYVADGQWHHIVMSIPASDQFAAGNGYIANGDTPSYLMIDGDHALVRYTYGFLEDSNTYGGAWLPYSVMARVTGFQGGSAQTPPNGYLNGDLSNFIVRLNTYTFEQDAQSLYYEWSDANVIHPTPATLSVSSVAPVKVKGNVKKMLVLYGLGFVQGHGAPAVGQPGDKLYQYLDVLSGMVVKTLSGGTSVRPATGYKFSPPVPFLLDDYFVTPVSIFGNLNNDSTYALSVNGTVNPDSPVTVNGIFVNDETGHPRFINLQNDLSANVVDEYDVITVVNYPWERPQDPSVGEYNYISPYQGFGDMNDSQWEQARDDLRDSILEAVYEGANLWIGDYYMAQHLGFIQGYDIHDFGRWGIAGFEFNTKAQDIDNAHLINGQQSNIIGSGTGDYFSYPQANYYRRLVNLVPGLTDLPSDELGDYIEGWNTDEWKPNGNFVAYDIVRRPDGLQLGDRLKMGPLWTGTKFFGESDAGTSLSFPTHRTAITSAHPDGIAGTIVAREQEFYYGRNGVVVQNPYKDNVTTIAAEQGTVVRGRPIGGRVFIELMCTEVGPGSLVEDADKNIWHGETASVANSTWAYDSRRSKETKVVLKSSLLGFGADGSITFNTKQTFYFQYQDGAYKYNTYLPMTYRGLVWLSQSPQIETGDARVFAGAMSLTVTTPNATLDKTSSPASQVIGAMRLGLSVRQPANYADGSVEVDIFGPMEMSLELRGLGRTVSVPPMSLTVTTPNPTLKVAADTVTVYLDEGRNITLFLKEDN